MNKRQCVQCSKSFDVSEQDLAFYNQIAVPIPQQCADCRSRRRLAHRNERALYTDECDLCHKEIISTFSPDKPNPVYCHECYYSDNWDPTSYGRDIDFTKPFFEQLHALQQVVPRVNLIKEQVENSEYVNIVGNSKNCYLIFGSVNCENCYYGNPYFCTDCVDSLLLRNSEGSYECITSENLYNCAYCQDCYDSNNLLYCYDVRGSSDLIGCAGLRNAKFQLFNQQVTEAEFIRYKEKLNLSDPDNVKQIEKQFAKVKAQHPRRYMVGVQNEQVSGNYVNHASNAQHCFDATKVVDSKFCYQAYDVKDSYDMNNAEMVERSYEMSGALRANNCRFGKLIWNASNVDYSERCDSVHDLFGCVSMKQASFCILNKQYSEAEYHELRNKLIEHMKQTREWGEYQPIAQSTFGYNETVAQEYYSLDEKTANTFGWNWLPVEAKSYQKQTYRIPRNIENVKDDLLHTPLACTNCKKNYKIIPGELKFYKQHALAIPRYCPDCRHAKRMALRTTRALWQRQCMCVQPDHGHGTRLCDAEFTTAYNPATSELVYCEHCYSKDTN